jgi:hypothetical protein
MVMTENPVMAVPNLEHIVHGVRNSQTWDFTTKEGLCSYQNAVVCALYAADANFGQLVKTEGQNHCTDPAGRYCATDVALYRPTGQVIDFIASAGYGTPPPSNDVTWGVGPEYEYGSDKWFAPYSAEGPIEPPPTESDDVVAQLTRIELMVSNINDQLNLMAGVVNQLYAERWMEGVQVRAGDLLRIERKG